MKNLQRSDFDYWSSIKTRWRDMDALGHLNHAVYLGYMESARVDVYPIGIFRDTKRYG